MVAPICLLLALTNWEDPESTWLIHDTVTNEKRHVTTLSSGKDQRGITSVISRFSPTIYSQSRSLLLVDQLPREFQQKRGHNMSYPASSSSSNVAKFGPKNKMRLKK